MNEIEEYLLMIFLESENILDINDLSPLTHSEFCRWENFKQEELGRTIPEEFEYFVSDLFKDHINKGANDFALSIFKSKTKTYKHKIKITFVEE